MSSVFSVSRSKSSSRERISRSCSHIRRRLVWTLAVTAPRARIPKSRAMTVKVTREKRLMPALTTSAGAALTSIQPEKPTG